VSMETVYSDTVDDDDVYEYVGEEDIGRGRKPPQPPHTRF